MFKEKPKSYCEYVHQLDVNNCHKVYHDNQYGFSIDDDNELFGRLILEINQAGLSWTTILKKQNNFRKAFSNFDIKKISNYDEQERTRLLDDPSIIRNKLKINSVIFNAQKIVSIQSEFGSFKIWLEENKGQKIEEWVMLFKKIFKFTGGEITKEFLISTGTMDGTHIKNCPIFNEINH